MSDDRIYIKIDSLTKAEEASLEKYFHYWEKVYNSTAEPNMEKAEAAFKELYRVKNIELKGIHWVDSPKAAKAKYLELTGRTIVASDFNLGCHASHWVGFHKWLRDEKNYDMYPELESLITLAHEVFWFLADGDQPGEDGIVVVCKKPLEVTFNEENRLHNYDDYAFKFRDNTGFALFNNILVPEVLMTTPAEEMTMDMVTNETNAEIRSEILKKMGPKNFLEQGNSRQLDEATGEELYKKFPIGNYLQQGDRLFTPDVGVQALKGGFKGLNPKTKIRLRQGVYYKLHEMELDGIKFRALEMGNPSVTGEIHVEWVPEDCESIIQAIGYRNQMAWQSVDQPFNWKDESQVMLPCQIS